MIVTIIGCMFSSKTTTLLSYERRFHILKKKVCIVKHSIDNRYTKDNKIISHDGYNCLYSDVFTTSKLLFIKNELEEYDCILIDEGQFFSDLKEFCDLFGNTKHIVIAGLINDYKCEPFQSIVDVLPISDKIIHLTALCTNCGNDAAFTSRIVEGTTCQTLIGSNDVYEPRCRKCHTIPK
jgi:thymidine kinase